MMHKGTFPRANCSARKRTLVHHRAETLRAEKIGALSDPNPTLVSAIVSCSAYSKVLWRHGLVLVVQIGLHTASPAYLVLVVLRGNAGRPLTSQDTERRPI